MGLRRQISGKMQQAEDDVAVECEAGDEKRRRSENVKQSGGEKERDVLDMVALNAPEALDPVVGGELARVRLGIERRLAQILGRPEASVDLHHPRDRQP
jgi:hypothetical protein